MTTLKEKLIKMKENEMTRLIVVGKGINGTIEIEIGRNGWVSVDRIMEIGGEMNHSKTTIHIPGNLYNFYWAGKKEMVSAKLREGKVQE